MRVNSITQKYISDYANRFDGVKDVVFSVVKIDESGFVPQVCGRLYPSMKRVTKERCIIEARRMAMAIVSNYQRHGIRARAVYVRQ